MSIITQILFCIIIFFSMKHRAIVCPTEIISIDSKPYHKIRIKKKQVSEQARREKQEAEETKGGRGQDVTSSPRSS